MANRKKEDLPLNYMQKRFVEEYLMDPSNATAAAKRAGYSITIAKEHAYHLLQDPRIKKMIDEVNADVAKKLGITKERIVQELAAIGFANLKHIMKEDADGNQTVNLAHLPDDKASPISEISVKGNRQGGKDVKVKIADKRAALIDLAKILGWHKDKVEVSGNLSIEKLIEQSYEIPSTEEDSSTEEETPSE